MTKKDKDNRGIVYSTDPSFQFEEDNIIDQETLLPAIQKLRIKLETKHRAGKAVTLVNGFVGRVADREELGKKIKNYCGTGGSVKDGEIIIQGDQREKVLQFLIKNGFTQSRKAGG